MRKWCAVHTLPDYGNGIAFSLDFACSLVYDDARADRYCLRSLKRRLYRDVSDAMPEYIRTYVPGGTFFFTLITHRRRTLFSSSSARSCLREAILGVQRERPFRLVASVLLPNHFHCIWVLPEGDADYSKRWGIIKSRFSRLWLAKCGDEITISPARAEHRERGIWQKRFWEHRIRDEDDFIHHVNYMHYSPVKHGLAQCPHQWQCSSFDRWVQQGFYQRDWLCDCAGTSLRVPDYLREGGVFGE
jgi:putative transposase